MYKPSQLDEWQKMLKQIQDKKHKYITVEEVREAMGYASTNTAAYLLSVMVLRKKAEKIGNHYHIKDD